MQYALLLRRRSRLAQAGMIKNGEFTRKLLCYLLLLVCFGPFVMVLGLLAPEVCAQGRTEQVITGIVTDPTGAVIPGSKIVVTNLASGVKVEVETNSNGLFRSPPLKPAEYEVEVTKTGFRRLVRSNVTLHLDEILRLDIRLELGEVSETVQVTSPMPLLTMEDPRTSVVLDREVIEKMPLLNRRLGGLIALGPGVYYEGQDPWSFFAPRFSIGGSSNAIYSINGAPAGSDRIDVGQMTLNPPVESIKEMQIQVGYYGAESGGAEGGLISIETKSGTNEMHGSLYEYFRNEIFDTRAFFSAEKQPDRYHVFGGSLGGPLKKDRAFFYINPEGSKQNLPQSGTFTLPTVAMRNGDFSQLGRTIYDPLTTEQDPLNPNRLLRDPFPGNIIPPERFDPVAVNVLSYYPDVTTPGPGNYSANWRNLIDRYAWTARFDVQLSPKDQLSYAWMFDRTTIKFTGMPGWKDAAAIPDFAENSWPYRLQSHIISHTRTFSPTLLNSLRFSFRPRTWDQRMPGYNPDAKWAETLGVKNITRDLAFPSFDFGGEYLQMGPGFAVYGQNPISQTEFAETLTYVRGKHTIKVGADSNRSIHALDGAINPTGSFSFNRGFTQLVGVGTTGDAIASFLLGAVDGAGLSDNGQMKYRQWYLAPYVTDTIRATQKLTFNIGVRWDIDFPVYEDLRGAFSGFDFNRINPVSGTPGVITFHGISPGTPKGLYNTDWNRLQPRFGFGYQFDDRTTIRGGYGIYSISPAYFSLFPPLLTGFSIAADLGFGAPDNFNPAFWLQDGFPPWPRGGDPSVLNDGFGAVPVGESPNTTARFVQHNWPLGYAQAMTLSVERELPGQILLAVSGIGNLGRKLPIGHDFNQLARSLWGVRGDRQALRPFPQFASVSDDKAPEGITNHWEMNVRLEKRLSQGLFFLTDLTWQKTTGVMGFEANDDHSLSRGPGVFFDQSNFPVGSPENLFRFTWGYDLPFGGGKPFLSSGPLKHIFGGWNVGGIWSWVGGARLTPRGGDSLNCYCGAGSRLDQIGDLTLDKPTLQRWFNTSAVIEPPFGRIGTLGLGVLKGPDFRNLDLAVSKTTAFSERYQIEFVWELFNATNTTKFGDPGTEFGSDEFGFIGWYRGLGGQGGSVEAPWYGARIMQFGLRFSW